MINSSTRHASHLHAEGIRNITYPFRLQGDPSGCGDPKYELICENNLTVFKQGGKKYFVAEINYHNYTIRMLDPGQKKGDCFSTPLYSSFSMPSCWKVSGGGTYSESCTIALDFCCSIRAQQLFNLRFARKATYGIELSFLHLLCISECSVKGLACDVDFNNNSIRCYRSGKCLYWALGARTQTFWNVINGNGGKRKHANTCLEQSQTYFPSWIYDRIDQGEDMEIGDATEDEHKYIRKIVIVALWCVQMNPTDRPSMSKALEMLEGEVELLQMPPGLLYTPGRCQLRII
ncbi:Rust resistance kinase Lr10 [Vitis vinifera]|uniref:Rust resistance kinase Lr10 n=1 Tax=Vitis vinifera TaxID=29760 RepID=A0A438CI26_VITVI|nr:Rust resistance kinase Lr10 [Vitis vinifera]